MCAIHLPYVARDHGLDAARAVDRLVELMRSDPGQQRAHVVVHPVLMRVAQDRAADMGKRNYFGHTDPDGHGPNWHVIAAGYALPTWYPQDRTANNIESIGGNFSAAEDFWAALINSPGHRAHVLGLHAMYAQQVHVGVGWAYDMGSAFRPVWTLLTCP